ncbi:hypothetical protein OIU74_014171 [Salix koriyanagi]|uniref:Uncharacterized protein n=1 Tax=Salix koriyanagi TaxID=2511006 RepID=A0A9Q0PVY4_9ROSI|nr:hypothetical protein OIU74_014171 [Salix koriyanagi]
MSQWMQWKLGKVALKAPARVGHSCCLEGAVDIVTDMATELLAQQPQHCLYLALLERWEWPRAKGPAFIENARSIPWHNLDLAAASSQGLKVTSMITPEDLWQKMLPGRIQNVAAGTRTKRCPAKVVPAKPVPSGMPLRPLTVGRAPLALGMATAPFWRNELYWPRKGVLGRHTCVSSSKPVIGSFAAGLLPPGMSKQACTASRAGSPAGAGLDGQSTYIAACRAAISAAMKIFGDDNA